MINKYNDYYVKCSEAQKQFLDCKSDLVIYGGAAASGKSSTSLLKILKMAGKENFRALAIKDNYVQLMASGGLVDTAKNIYDLPVFSQWGMSPKIEFGNSSSVEFVSCEKGVSDLYGKQASMIVVDEMQHMSAEDTRELFGRLRSYCEEKHQMVWTCNPNPDNEFLLSFVSPYLDEDGFPRRGMFAIERYFIFDNDKVVTSCSKENLSKDYPNRRILSYTFIHAAIYDNPALMKNSPDYIKCFENMNKKDRNRLLYGCWKD